MITIEQNVKHRRAFFPANENVSDYFIQSIESALSKFDEVESIKNKVDFDTMSVSFTIQIGSIPNDKLDVIVNRVNKMSRRLSKKERTQPALCKVHKDNSYAK